MLFRETIGNYWTDIYRSPVPASFADAVTLLCKTTSMSGTTGGRLLLWTPTGGTIDPITGWVGYQPPSITPGVIYTEPNVGPALTVGLDFAIIGGKVWFPTTVTQPLWVVESQPPAAVPTPRVSTVTELLATVAQVFDAPAFTTASTVRAVITIGVRYVVATDAEMFYLHTGNTPAVVIGQSVGVGTPVGTAWQLARVGPRAPTTDVALPVGLLPSGALGTVVWPNTLVATTVDTVGGRTRVRWPLGGSSADVNLVWTTQQNEALAGRTSIAQMLDIRVSPVGEPTAANIPALINPATFMATKVMRGGAYVVWTNSAGFGPDAASTVTRGQLLANAAPPGYGVIELPGGIPSYTLINPS